MQDLEHLTLFRTQLTRENFEGSGDGGAYFWNTGSDTGVKVIPIRYNSPLTKALTEAAIGEVLTKPSEIKEDRLEGIVTHYDHKVFTNQDNTYLALKIEHAGVSLIGLLNQNSRLKNKGIFKVLSNVSGAISYTHEKGIHFADLSLKNIYCHTIDGRITDAKLGDFGNSALVGRNDDLVKKAREMDLQPSDLNKEGETPGGTFEYMAPEQGKRRELQSDVYGLGIICYELFTGKNIARKLKNTDQLNFSYIKSHNDRREELIPEFEQAVDTRLSRLKKQYNQAIENFKYLVKSAIDFRQDKRPKVEQIHKYTKAINNALYGNNSELETLNQETLGISAADKIAALMYEHQIEPIQ